MIDYLSVTPHQILPHGYTKLYVDKNLLYSHEHGMASCYNVKESDVKDHFNVFRGADLLESFGQTACIYGTIALASKYKLSLKEFKQRFKFFNISGNYKILNSVESKDVVVCIGKVTFFKFRQITFEGHIFKCHRAFDLDEYFREYTSKDLSELKSPTEFKLVSQMEVGIRAISESKIKG